MNYRFAVLAVFAFLAPSLFAQQKLITVSPNDGYLRQVDPVTGVTLTQVQLTIASGGSVAQGHGIAVDPTTGFVYAIASLTAAGNPPKHLLRVKVSNGVCTDIGSTGERLAGIAFDSNGQLYGVSGDGGIVAETLFRIDKATAAIVQLKHLGNGSTGETLTFEPYDGMLYHGSGTGGLLNDPSGTILEKIDPVTLAITPVTLSGYYPGGLAGLGRDDYQTLWCCDLSPTLLRIATNGVITSVAQLDHIAKGLVWVDGPSYYSSFGSGCAGSGGATPTLIGSGTPNPGYATSLAIGNAAAGAAALLLVGTGTGTANVVPGCAVQLLPLVPQLTIPFTLSGAGTTTLPVVIPPTATSIDLYVQVLIADPGAAFGVASTAPLRIHLQ